MIHIETGDKAPCQEWGNIEKHIFLMNFMMPMKKHDIGNENYVAGALGENKYTKKHVFYENHLLYKKAGVV